MMDANGISSKPKRSKTRLRPLSPLRNNLNPLPSTSLVVAGPLSAVTSNNSSEAPLDNNGCDPQAAPRQHGPMPVTHASSHVPLHIVGDASESVLGKKRGLSDEQAKKPAVGICHVCEFGD